MPAESRAVERNNGLHRSLVRSRSPKPPRQRGPLLPDL